MKNTIETKKWEVLYTILPQQKVRELIETNEKWNVILDLPYPPESLKDIVDTLHDLMVWYDPLNEEDEEVQTFFTIMVTKNFPYLEALKQEYPDVNYIVV